MDVLRIYLDSAYSRVDLQGIWYSGTTRNWVHVTEYGGTPQRIMKDYFNFKKSNAII